MRLLSHFPAKVTETHLEHGGRPLKGADVHEKGTGGIGDIDEMETTVLSSGEVLWVFRIELRMSVQNDCVYAEKRKAGTYVEHPRVDGSKGEVVGFVCSGDSWVVLDHPVQLDR